MDRFYQEYFDMFMGFRRKNYRQAANTYAERYPNRERKLHIFKRLLECFIAYGTVKKKNTKKNSYL